MSSPFIRWIRQREVLEKYLLTDDISLEQVNYILGWSEEQLRYAQQVYIAGRLGEVYRLPN